MKLKTTNFGNLELDPDAILLFPDGLIGFETFRHWVLLPESDDDAVGWLQSLNDPGLAFSVITPHRFVPKYQLKIGKEQLGSLPWTSSDESILLALVSNHDGQLTVNLKSPIIVNLHRGLGRQVIVADDQPIQYALSAKSTRMRKSA